MRSVSPWKNLRTAQVADDDLSYLTYYADNIAAFTDRREAEEGEGGFDKTVPLDSVFNILNGNHEKKHYAMQVLDPHAGINYPDSISQFLWMNIFIKQ